MVDCTRTLGRMAPFGLALLRAPHFMSVGDPGYRGVWVVEQWVWFVGMMATEKCGAIGRKTRILGNPGVELIPKNAHSTCGIWGLLALVTGLYRNQ